MTFKSSYYKNCWNLDLIIPNTKSQARSPEKTLLEKHQPENPVK